MPQFAYYIPGRKSIAKTDLAALGLERCFPGEINNNADVSGPDGGVGVVVSADAESTDARGKQWENCGKYWIGWNPESPPGPSDLKREDAIDGHELTLGDGRQWMCPEWRLVPVTFSQFDPSMAMARRVSPAYEHLSKIVDAVTRIMYEGEAAEDRDLIIHALAALNVNYRVGFPEASALGLVTTSSVRDILKVLVGAFKKKADSAGESSQPGVTG